MPFPDQARDWLGRAAGARPDALTVTQLPGSTSSSVYRVDGGPRPLVLRVLDNARWLAEEPDLAPHEAAALDEAARAGLPAPRCVAHAEGDESGFGAPVVLMTFLEGRIELRPADMGDWLTRLAQTLAAIHRHSAPAFPWHFCTWVDRENLAVPAWTAAPAIWERAIARWHGPVPADPPVFLHRDYHPTNILWRGDALTGVVDWINACRGPAGVDVGHCRINLAQMYGPAVADAFLAAYQAAAPGYAYDPYWDIETLLDMGLEPPSFYPPWAEFGLDVLPSDLLARRVDAFLEGVVRRL